LPRGDPGQHVASNNKPAIDDRTYHAGGGESFDLDYALYGLTTIQGRAASIRGDPD
jgi:hypothetical protein